MLFIVNQVFRQEKTFLSLDGYSSWFLHKTNALGGFGSEENKEFKHFSNTHKYFLVMAFKHFSQSIFLELQFSMTGLCNLLYAVSFRHGLILCTMDREGLSISTLTINAVIYHIHTSLEKVDHLPLNLQVCDGVAVTRMISTYSNGTWIQPRAGAPWF